MSSDKFWPLSFCFAFSHDQSIRLSLFHSLFNVTAMLKMLMQDAGIIHYAISNNIKKETTIATVHNENYLMTVREKLLKNWGGGGGSEL